MQLAALPEKAPTTVVVGTSVRKPAAVLRHYLQSLAWQDLPPNVRVVPCFVADTMEPEAEALLRDWTAERGGVVLAAPRVAVADFTDQHPDTHQWSATAMERVGAAKDRIFAHARAIGADYVWLADADLICDRTTLASLLSCGAPIATAVYWTRWSARGAETRKIHAAPQVWLRHPYELSGGGLTEAEFRDRLARRALTRVPGYGACTLISRKALEAGVSFAPVPGAPRDGLMAGEDRQFCLRASALHLEAVADPWPDIFHVYHVPADLAAAPDWAKRLGTPHPETPRFGDLVSVTVEALEPVVYAGGGVAAVPPQRIRGRLGGISFVPELEDAVAGLTRGAFTDIAVHFPAHYPIPPYAGQRRLFRVTLHDCKPAGFAPVLESEMLVNRLGSGARTTEFSARQLDGMRDIAESAA
jgi:hypothetical protein